MVRYGFAVAAVLLSFGIKKVLEPVTGPSAPFLLFFGIVATSVWAGPGPGICATLLSLLLGAYAFIARAGYTPSQSLAQAVLFAVDGLVVVYLSYLMARTRRAAERSEAHQRALIDLAPDAFFLANIEGRFTDANQSACRMLGYDRQELIGRTIAEVLPAEELPRLADVRTKLLVPGQVERSEWRHVRKDGTIVSVEVSANILPGGLWQAFVRDITERKRIEWEQRLLAEAGAVLASSLDYEQTLTTLGRARWCASSPTGASSTSSRARRPSPSVSRSSARTRGQAPLAARLEQCGSTATAPT